MKHTVIAATIVFVVGNDCIEPDRLDTSSNSHVDVSNSLLKDQGKIFILFSLFKNNRHDA